MGINAPSHRRICNWRIRSLRSTSDCNNFVMREGHSQLVLSDYYQRIIFLFQKYCHNDQYEKKKVVEVICQRDLLRLTEYSDPIE